jgi:Zn-dependent protease with chaperone function
LAKTLPVISDPPLLTILKALQALVLLSDFLAAALLAWLSNSLALGPFRRVASQHWTERARRLFPARRGAVSNLWIIPASLALAQRWLWPETTPHWLLVGFAGWVGTMTATWFFDHEVFPRLTWHNWLHEAVAGWTIRFLWWFLFFGAIAVMPEQLDWRAWTLGGLLVLAYGAWARGGLIWSYRKLRMLAPAPDRLRRIVMDVSERMRLSVRRISLLRSSTAGAFALPWTEDLLFSERLLTISSDDEIAAIAAHELGHLGESRLVLAGRLMIVMVYLPWAYIKPLTHTLGASAFLLLVLISWLVLMLWRVLSRKLETRADRIATAHEQDAGAFARALAKLHEDNLIPAVLSPGRHTHPDLYDRLMVSGVDPDYPRPTPPSSVNSPTLFLAGMLGLLIGVTFLHSLPKAQELALPPDDPHVINHGTFLDLEFQQTTSKLSKAQEPQTNR